MLDILLTTRKALIDFFNDSRTAECTGCGRTREQVRYDELPPKCSNHRETYTKYYITSKIYEEEKISTTTW